MRGWHLRLEGQQLLRHGGFPPTVIHVIMVILGACQYDDFDYIVVVFYAYK